MQLRVARLCLDCEELHIQDACPICASERYAFLSAWLPSEERRRWRRATQAPSETAASGVSAVIGQVARWLNVGDAGEKAKGPHTRASDHVPNLNFGEPVKAPQKKPALDPQPAKPDGH